GIIHADEVDLAPVDATAVVDHLEVSGFCASNSSIFLAPACVGRDVANLDFRVGRARVVRFLRRRRRRSHSGGKQYDGGQANHELLSHSGTTGRATVVMSLGVLVPVPVACWKRLGLALSVTLVIVKSERLGLPAALFDTWVKFNGETAAMTARGFTPCNFFDRVKRLLLFAFFFAAMCLLLSLYRPRRASDDPKCNQRANCSSGALKSVSARFS